MRDEISPPRILAGRFESIQLVAYINFLSLLQYIVDHNIIRKVFYQIYIYNNRNVLPIA